MSEPHTTAFAAAGSFVLTADPAVRWQDVGTPDPESFKKAINLADRGGEVAYDEFAVR
jgi:hypothetical protein